MSCAPSSNTEPAELIAVFVADMLQAKGAAIDLGSTQLDQFEQMLVEPGLLGHLRQRKHRIVNVGRGLLEVFILASGMGHRRLLVLS